MEETQKANKPFYKKWWVWVLGVFVLLVALGSIGSSEPSPEQVSESGSTSNNQQEQEQREVYEVGESIKLGSSVVTVNDVDFSNGGQFNQPSAGNQYLNLNITIENTSNSQQYITTMGQMFVRDDEENSYQVAVTGKTIENPNNNLDGTVIANSKRAGWVGFEVPQDASGLQFQYNGSVWGDGQILVNLQ